MVEQTWYYSPFGCFAIVGSELGISRVRKISDEACPAGPAPALLRPCVHQLEEYFRGDRKAFNLQLDWGGATDFYKKVWQALLQIPYGQTTSYSAIAEKIGQPDALRAVGLANRNNPIAIIVPCHRVIGKSGELHGYFYGLDMKRKLLELENPLSFARQGSLFDE